MSPTDDQLRQFLLGTLPVAEAERVAAWVEASPEAAERLARLEPMDSLVAALDRGGPVAGALDTADLLAGSADTVTTPSARLPHLPGHRLVRELGRGGMGAVYEAEDERLRRRVAVKVMLPEIAARPEARERFLREARALAAVESEFIVPIFQVGETPAGIPFLVMPLLAGETLHARLARGPLPPAELARVARDAAAGLAAAHARGLIHRDVKPSNLWVETGDGGAVRRVRVLDFGLARPVGRAGEFTGPQQVLGSVHFMSPEQARGADLDARTDLFSLGATLYRAATGRLPFPGDNPSAVLTALAVDDPPPVRSLAPTVPLPLARLIARLLAKSPDDRPPSAEAVLADLAPDRPRSPLAWVGLAVAGVVLAVVVAAAAFVATRNPPARSGTDSDSDLAPPSPTFTDTVGSPFKPDGAPPDPWPVPTFGPVKPPTVGGPLTAKALTTRPAPLRDVLSWTVTTKLARTGVVDLAITPDGSRVAVVGTDNVVRVYTTGDGKFVAARFLDSPLYPTAVQWNAAGDRLIVSTSKAVIAFPWPTGPAMELRWQAEGDVRLDGYRGQPVVSPDGARVAEATDDAVRVYDLTTGQRTNSVPTTGHGKQGNGARKVAWSSTGDFLAVFTPNQLDLMGKTPPRDSVLELVDLSKGTSVATIPAGTTNAMTLAVSAGGKRVAFPGPGGVSVWEDGKVSAVPLGGGTTLQFSADGNTLYGDTGRGKPLSAVDVSKPNAPALEIAGTSNRPVSFSATLRAFLPPLAPRERSWSEVAFTDANWKKRYTRTMSLPFPLDTTPDGHYRAGPSYAGEVVYQLLTDRGQETLTPAEFEKRTGWKNDLTKFAPPK